MVNSITFGLYLYRLAREAAKEFFLPVHWIASRVRSAAGIEAWKSDRKILTAPSVRRWRTIAYLGILFGVIACAANVRIAQSLRNAEALVEKSHGLILGIELERPHQGDLMLDYRTEIVGRVELRADSGETLIGQNEVRSELDRRGLELVAVVHPLATDAWWVQPPVKIDSDGSFRSLVYIGEQEFGKGEEFEIAAILVPRGNFREGLRLRDIPMTYGSSSIIKVRRKM